MSKRTLMPVLLMFVGPIAWAGQGKIDRWPDKLHEGGPASDFTLKSPDEKTTVQLSKLTAKKPVVLIFGSYT